MNDNLLGRFTALVLILGAVYGVHAISRGGLGCPAAHSSCCAMSMTRGEASEADEASPAKPAAAGAVEADDEAKLLKKAPVVPPAPAEQAD